MDLVSLSRPSTMKSLLSYFFDARRELHLDSVVVEGEYRRGIHDPSRTAAQWEKCKGIKKVVGRKALVEEYLKRVNAMKDYKIGLREWLICKERKTNIDFIWF